MLRVFLAKPDNAVVLGTGVLELTGKTDTENGQRLRSYLFRKKEILVETKTIALVIVGEETMRECIVPAIFIYRTVLDRTNRIFPLVAGGQVGTLHDTSSGETKCRTGSCQDKG